MNTEAEVVIVLSDEFAPDLADVAVKHHVWALRTAETEKVARAIWGEREGLEGGEPSNSITLFQGTGDPEADLLSISDTVELHHGIATSGQPATRALRVLGTGATDAVRGALAALSFTRIVPISGGFVAHWHHL